MPLLSQACEQMSVALWNALTESTMQNAHDTVKAYFDALVAKDAETLIGMMLPAAYYVKIGTDADEVVEGSTEIAAYYQNHVREH